MANEEEKIILKEDGIDLNENVLEIVKILSKFSEEERVLISDMLRISEGILKNLLSYPKKNKILILEMTKKMIEAEEEEEKKLKNLLVKSIL